MNNIAVKVSCIILVVLSVIQVQAKYTLSKEKEKMSNITEKVNKSSSIKYKDLSKLNNELSSFKNCSIIGAINDGEKWKVKVKISGYNTNILSEITKLQKYEIASYNIVKNNDEKFIVLEMYGIQ